MTERQIELMPSQKLIKNTFSAIARISMLERINAYIARMHDKKESTNGRIRFFADPANGS
jgi:hypothetical protein